jgi:hypothetical protein
MRLASGVRLGPYEVVDALPLPTLWWPQGHDTRTQPTFSEAARRIGLVDVWEREGPPDLCRRVEPQKYVRH